MDVRSEEHSDGSLPERLCCDGSGSRADVSNAWSDGDTAISQPASLIDSVKLTGSIGGDTGLTGLCRMVDTNDGCHKASTYVYGPPSVHCSSLGRVITGLHLRGEDCLVPPVVTVLLSSRRSFNEGQPAGL